MATVSDKRQKRPKTTATVRVKNGAGRTMKVPEKKVPAWEQRGWTRVGAAPAAPKATAKK